MPDNAEPKRPTIDERLERLTERHEALTQTVELIAAMQRDNEKRFAGIATTLQQIANNQKRDGEHILALVRVAELHDRRLTHLEGGQP